MAAEGSSSRALIVGSGREPPWQQAPRLSCETVSPESGSGTKREQMSRRQPGVPGAAAGGWAAGGQVLLGPQWVRVGP